MSTRPHLLLVITMLILGACSGQQSPNASLPAPGGRSVTVGDWQLEARGAFADPDRATIRVDLVVRRIGDPSHVIASPSVITTVGEDAKIGSFGGEHDVEVTVTSVRGRDGVEVTAKGVVGDGASVKSTLPLRFVIR